MQQPEWANQLIKDVLFLHNRTKAPRIKWIASRGKWSSGVTYGTRSGKLLYYRVGGKIVRKRNPKPDILIRQSQTQQYRYVLLHELGHWLVKGKHHHDKVFWRKAWNLYFVFLTLGEIEECKKSEFSYKNKAEQVYQELTEK